MDTAYSMAKHYKQQAMNGVIKFRAWDKTMQAMNYKVLVGNTDINDENYTCNSILVNGEWMNADENCIELMQFTGLHDKNGAEVYEKDILGGLYESGYIDYCQQCKCFQYHLVDFGCMACERDIFWHELVKAPYEIEVVGNVFSNPEMLQP